MGNAPLDGVEIVDILPHIGDTALLDNAPRGSEFRLYIIDEVSARIVSDEEQNVAFDVYYSRSNDPLRFDGAFSTTGSADDWSAQLPTDLTSLRAFKVATKNTQLKPSDILEILVTLIAPTGVLPSKIAWNSFAADVKFTDEEGAQKHLLGVEPEKVGIRIEENPEGRASIGGYSFLDKGGDGKFDDGEDEFVNDVGVGLYDAKGEFVAGTFTAPDVSQTNGQYVFNNLPPAKYYLRFFIDGDYKFTKQTEQGSIANSRGVSQIIDLTQNLNIKNAHVGIREKYNHNISEIIKVNDSARSMLRNVTYDRMLISMKMEDVLDLL